MTRRRTRRSVSVARVALLFSWFACGWSLEGPRLQTIALDGNQIRPMTAGIESEWFSAFAAADIDLDGDDELLVLRDGAVGFMQADGRTTTMLEVSASVGVWALGAAGDRADLFVWTGPGFGGDDDTTITHAVCDLGQQSVCTATGMLTIDGPVAAMTAGDFDEDGHVDVATSGDVFTVHTSTGEDLRHPAWVEGERLLGESATGSRYGIASADLDGDGHLDVVAAAGQRGVRLFFGAGDGTFGQIRPEIDDEITWADAVRLTDLDGDTLPEIVVFTDSSNLVVLRRLRDRTFGDAALPMVWIGESDWFTDAVLPGDFDGDGRDELLLAGWPDSGWLAELGGQPRAWTMTRLDGEPGGYGVDPLAADLDGAGRDVVVQLLPEELAPGCAIGGAPARRR